MINTELRDRFKKLYLEKFGIELSNEDATAMSADLVNLVKVLLKPTSESTKTTQIFNATSHHETIGLQQY